MKCERCGKSKAYSGARFCGAACSTAHEMNLPMPFVCTLCGSDAKWDNDDNGAWRHAKQPYEDNSTFCSRYGYPIQVITQEINDEYRKN
jgi:hypothetical protein